MVFDGSAYIYENIDYKKRAFITNCNNENEINIIKISSTNISMSIDLDRPCTLVLSNVWYPGWKAYDNNNEIIIGKFEGVLKSVNINEGNHIVEFIYKPI